MFKNPAANQLRLAAYLQLFETLGFIIYIYIYIKKVDFCRNSEPLTVPIWLLNSKSP